MSWQGAAQVIVNATAVVVDIEVKRYGQTVVAYRTEVDTGHIAAQLKMDILSDQSRPIPQEMRDGAQDSQLIVSIDGARYTLSNFDRLSKFGDDFKGGDIRLQLYAPGADTENDNPPQDLEADFNVHTKD